MAYGVCFSLDALGLTTVAGKNLGSAAVAAVVATVPGHRHRPSYHQHDLHLCMDMEKDWASLLPEKKVLPLVTAAVLQCETLSDRCHCQVSVASGENHVWAHLGGEASGGR